MECRENCGACCIIPSINTPFLNMPAGKPAGIPCIHLNRDLKCGIFNSDDRPDFCIKFQAEELVCGSSRLEAICILADLEGLEIDLIDFEA